MNKFIHALIVFTACQSLFSQEVYDLNRCITTGLERNYSILIARNQETVSDNNFTPGNAGLLPTFGLNSRYGGTLTNTEQTLTGGEEESSAGIYNTSGDASVDLGWTLFRGFSARTTYKKLNELKAIGELNTRMSLENLVADIVSEYYYYVQQLQLFKNLRYAVSLSRERVRIDEERYLLGSSSKLQLLQSMVYLNSDSSRCAKQSEVLKTAQVRLNELMAADNLDQILVLKDTVISLNTGLIYDSLLIQTLEANTGLLIAGRNRTVSEYDYKIIASRKYPYLNFSSGYSYSFNNYETGSVRDRRSNGLNYGLTMGVDLFDGFNRKRERRNALIDVENKLYQYRQVEKEVLADLITIYYAYSNNLRLLKLENQNLATARENLEIALERYKLGNLSGLELREVQKSLLDAEERLLAVQYATKLAEVSLLQISGRIMEYL